MATEIEIMHLICLKVTATLQHAVESAFIKNENLGGNNIMMVPVLSP
jgi:hypothetical protein